MHNQVQKHPNAQPSSKTPKCTTKFKTKISVPLKKFWAIYVEDNKDEAAESCTVDGESPVVKVFKICLIPSSMGHVKSRVNPRGPPRKAKYS